MHPWSMIQLVEDLRVLSVCLVVDLVVRCMQLVHHLMDPGVELVRHSVQQLFQGVTLGQVLPDGLGAGVGEDPMQPDVLIQLHLHPPVRLVLADVEREDKALVVPVIDSQPAFQSCSLQVTRMLDPHVQLRCPAPHPLGCVHVPACLDVDAGKVHKVNSTAVVYDDTIAGVDDLEQVSIAIPALHTQVVEPCLDEARRKLSLLTVERATSSDVRLV